MTQQGGSLQQAALVEARKWIGTPYQHQASLCQVGSDCLGLVRGVWRHLYGPEPFEIPAYGMHWAEMDDADTLLQAAQHYLAEIPIKSVGPGDVLLFRFSPKHVAKHCAIMSAPLRIIHAYWGQSVSETSLTPWWQRRITAAFRFPD